MSEGSVWLRYHTSRVCARNLVDVQHRMFPITVKAEKQN